METDRAAYTLAIVPGVSDGARRRPSPSLRRYVRWYDGYRLAGFPPGEHRGLPSTDLTVVLTIGEPLELSVPAARGQQPGRFTALASGLATVPVTIAHDGNQHGIQLSITPAGARALFGVPASALGAWVVDLEDVLGADARELRDRIAATDDWPDRFAVLDEVLGRSANHDSAVDTELSRAWQRLTDRDGSRVSAIADDIGWSRRHLTSRFTAEFGVGPKDAARLARFERSRQLLGRPGRHRLADIAARAGFYDQAHLARDWRDLAGAPPTQWMFDEVFPIVQDTDGGPGAR